MRFAWQYILVAIVFGYFAACAPVKFQGAQNEPTVVPPQQVSDVCPRVCGAAGTGCVLRCEIEKTVGASMVDILIINDNSGSMSTEQKKMASRFPDFLNSIHELDYRIAMTTTDVSSTYSQTPVGRRNDPDYYNQNGKLQDGNLIEFSSGLKFLTKDTPGKESLFNSTIQRQETINCESSRYQTCPSDDERGIFAANLVLDRTAPEFMRPTSHLAVILLSDEDERGLSDSRSDVDAGDAKQRSMFPIEEYDKPETFVRKMSEKYPGKTVSVHSIIVIPGDKACRDEQSSQGTFVRGVEGFSYAKWTELTRGTMGTICSSDYGAQLQNISSSIQMQISALPFHCRPHGDQFTVTYTPQPPQTIRASADFAKMQLVIEDPLPPLTKVRLTYDCPVP